MYKDPIVEEVRKYREENAAKFGFDVRKIAEDAMRRQATSGHPVVDLSRKRLPKKKTIRVRKRAGSAATG